MYIDFVFLTSIVNMLCLVNEELYFTATVETTGSASPHKKLFLHVNVTNKINFGVCCGFTVFFSVTDDAGKCSIFCLLYSSG